MLTDQNTFCQPQQASVMPYLGSFTICSLSFEPRIAADLLTTCACCSIEGVEGAPSKTLKGHALLRGGCGLQKLKGVDLRDFTLRLAKPSADAHRFVLLCTRKDALPSYLGLAGNEGIEKNMETTIVGYIWTTTRSALKLLEASSHSHGRCCVCVCICRPPLAT